MKVKCPHCGAEARVAITGANPFRTTIIGDALEKCPIILERLKEPVDDNEHICPHLDGAVNEEAQRLKGRRE
jgi:hypothetical protein